MLLFFFLNKKTFWKLLICTIYILQGHPEIVVLFFEKQTVIKKYLASCLFQQKKSCMFKQKKMSWTKTATGACFQKNWRNLKLSRDLKLLWSAYYITCFLSNKQNISVWVYIMEVSENFWHFIITQKNEASFSVFNFANFIRKYRFPYNGRNMHKLLIEQF